MLRVDHQTRTVTVSEGGEALTEFRAAAERTPVVSPPPVAAPPSRAGWFATGTVLSLIGIGGTIGFGTWTLRLKDDFRAEPDPSTQDDGIRARRLTNASIAVLGVGLVGLLIATILKVRDSEPTPDLALHF